VYTDAGQPHLIETAGHQGNVFLAKAFGPSGNDETSLAVMVFIIHASMHLYIGTSARQMGALWVALIQKTVERLHW
jgi:hypothetical protein